MIFQETWKLILDGIKTQTRRIAAPHETLRSLDGNWSVYSIVNRGINTKCHIKWQVDRIYDVTPGRGFPAVWWHPEQFPVEYSKITLVSQTGKILTRHDFRPELIEKGYRPLQIRVLDLKREPIQAISPEDVRAEGVDGVDTFSTLWNTVYKKRPQLQWEKNPSVWVITFEMVK